MRFIPSSLSLRSTRSSQVEKNSSVSLRRPETVYVAPDRFELYSEPKWRTEAKESDLPYLYFQDIVWPFRNQPKSITHFPNSFDEICEKVHEYLRYRSYHPGITWKEKYWYLLRDWDEKSVEEMLYPKVVVTHREDVQDAYERLRVVLDMMQEVAGRIVDPEPKMGEIKWDLCHWDECL